jgi:hypothetical protein
MRVSWRTALLAVAIGCAAAGSVKAERKEPAKKPAGAAQVNHILPRAERPEPIRAIVGQLPGAIVFRDPVTGERRAPEPGEHAALTARGQAARVAAPPAPIPVPGGGVALLVDASRLEFMSVARTGGKLVHRCTNSAHAHAQIRGGGNEK